MDKTKKFPTSLQNYIETGVRSQYARLPSLRAPRDLTLSDKKPKKTFTPNFNAVRLKDRSKIIVKQQIEQKKHNEKRHKNNRLDVNKFARIEAKGAFSEGIFEKKHVKARRDCDERKLPLPVLKKTPIVNRTKVKQENERSSIVHCSSDSNSDEENDKAYTPIVLPLSQNKEGFYSIFKPKPIVKDEENSTSQPGLRINNSFNCESEQLKTAFLHPKSVNEENPIFSIVMMPSSFDGKWISDETDKPNADYIFRNMQQGKIGKLVVRQSGKMEVVIENTNFDISTETLASSVQEVVMAPGPETTSIEPSTTTLGRVGDMLHITPQWNQLFQQKDGESEQNMIKHLKPFHKFYNYM